MSKCYNAPWVLINYFKRQVTIHNKTCVSLIQSQTPDTNLSNHAQPKAFWQLIKSADLDKETYLHNQDSIFLRESMVVFLPMALVCLTCQHQVGSPQSSTGLYTQWSLLVFHRYQSKQ